MGNDEEEQKKVTEILFLTKEFDKPGTYEDILELLYYTTHKL